MIPKFKAWDTKTNDWYDDKDQSLVINLYGTEIINSWNGELMDDYTERIILLQSTGLKDKNGVEIYEGDIVKINQERSFNQYIPNNSVHEIVYKDSAFCVKETRETGDIEWPIIAGLYYKVSEEFEVVGNVYENPELLEVH